MKNNRTVVQWFLIVGVVLVALLGCGKKESPQPPEIKGQVIAAPFDLKHTLGEKNIELSWKHRIDREDAFIEPSGFEIFMSRKTFDDCEGCPFVFEMVGFVSMPAKKFVFRLEKGFQYYFRVQAVGDDDMRSDYSKTIQFEHR